MRSSVFEKREFILEVTFSLPLPSSMLKLPNFSNDDGDGYENVKTATGLLNETSSLHVHHAFLYISLPLLHDYDVKMPNFTPYV